MRANEEIGKNIALRASLSAIAYKGLSGKK
jgi:hypothetical protein